MRGFLLPPTFQLDNFSKSAILYGIGYNCSINGTMEVLMKKLQATFVLLALLVMGTVTQETYSLPTFRFVPVAAAILSKFQAIIKRPQLFIKQLKCPRVLPVTSTLLVGAAIVNSTQSNNEIIDERDLRKAFFIKEPECGIGEVIRLNNIHLPMTVCLHGKVYTLTEKIGQGRQGRVFAMQSAEGTFALKIYDYKSLVLGDEFAMSHICVASDVVNIPCVVSQECGYSIAPLLDKTVSQAFGSSKSEQERSQIMHEYNTAKQKTAEALAKDCFRLLDEHGGNFMYSKDGLIKRIDLSDMSPDKTTERCRSYWLGHGKR
jgi:hypothetical protein